MDFDYPFANLPSALVEPLPPVFPLLSYFNLSLSGWTSGVAARRPATFHKAKSSTRGRRPRYCECS